MVRSPSGIYHKKNVSKVLEDIILVHTSKTIRASPESNHTELAGRNPELEVYKNYFSNVTKNNSYIVILKQAVVHHMQRLREYEPLITNSTIGSVINISRVAVNHYLKPGIEKHPDYNEVVLIMDKMIKQNKYPHAKSVTINNIKKIAYEWR